MAESATSGGPAAGVRWDLSHLYAGPDDPKIEQDLSGALTAATAFAERYRGQVASLDAPALARALDELEALQEPAARAGSFAGLTFAADTQTPRHGALLQHVQERGTEIRNALLFFELEWLAADAQTADALLADPRLGRRRHFLAGLRRYREHVLSEPEERVLAEAHNTGSAAWSRLFDQIMADLQFEVALGGEVKKLSEEETLALLYDSDRETRRAAAAGLSSGLRANARVLGFIFNILVQDKASDDRRRSYARPDGRATPRQRGAARERRGAARCMRRALRPGGALLPAQGASARTRPRSPTTTAMRRSAEPRASAASARRAGS